MHGCCWFKLVTLTRLYIAVPCDIQLLSHLWVGRRLSVSAVVKSLNLSLLRIEIERYIRIDITDKPSVSPFRSGSCPFARSVWTDHLIRVPISLIVSVSALTSEIVLLSIALPRILVQVIVETCRSN